MSHLTKFCLIRSQHRISSLPKRRQYHKENDDSLKIQLSTHTIVVRLVNVRATEEVQSRDLCFLSICTTKRVTTSYSWGKSVHSGIIIYIRQMSDNALIMVRFSALKGDPLVPSKIYIPTFFPRKKTLSRCSLRSIPFRQVYALQLLRLIP